MTEQHKTRRCLPCADHDVEAMESWLTDLAAQGWFLARDGFCLAWATFVRGEPRQVRYRLTASLQSTEFGGEGWQGPGEEALALHASYGWDYVAKRGKFYVYRTQEEGARELDTDPQTQELLLREVHRRENRTLVSCLFWGLLYPLLLIRKDPLLTLLNAGLWPFVLGLAVVLWFFGFYLARSAHYRRLRKKLQAGQGLDHRKPWQVHAWRQAARRAVSAGLLAAFALSMGYLLLRPETPPQGPLPFPTVTELCQGTGWRVEEIDLSGSRRAVTGLTADQIHWAETTQVTAPGGQSALVFLLVDYYDTASPRLAAAIARETRQRDQDALDQAGRSAVPLSLPPLPVDAALGYEGDTGLPTVILQKGNRVLRAVLLLGEGAPLTLETCLTDLAACLTAPS